MSTSLAFTVVMLNLVSKCHVAGMAGWAVPCSQWGCSGSAMQLVWLVGQCRVVSVAVRAVPCSWYGLLGSAV